MSEKNARQAALDVLASASPSPTEVVEFTSQGRVALLAPAAREQDVKIAAEALSAPASPLPPLIDSETEVTTAVDGYLGNFTITAGGRTVQADAVLDFHDTPLIQQFNPQITVLPPGYFAAVKGKENDAITAVAGMHGVFRKPKYYQYYPELCAHGASGVRGCERCLSACPAGAIESAGEKVHVNSNLCQGCGLCTMTCPSGAMRYAYPPPGDTLRALQSAISAYRQHSQTAPTIIFYAAECESAADIPDSPQLIPAAVEEAGAAGLEMWLCALAFGAAEVLVFADNPQLAALAHEQAKIAGVITDALGMRRAVRVIENASAATVEYDSSLTAAATFAPDDDKRTMFFMAFNHLAAAQTAPEKIVLPEGAPFGEIQVNTDTCTLCMACAGVCPSSAVRAGGDSPRLNFVEENCLQCGLCETACPENAIALSPRLLSDATARRRARVLNEDQPLLCLECSKPFAGARMIGRIEAKLKGHWMFQNEKERRRLRLCEECRVRDMFAD